MPLASATITFDLSDMLGVDFDIRRTKVWVDTNIPDDTVIDTDGNKIRLGSGNVTLNTDGTGSLSTWTPGVGANPATWQITVHVDYPDRNKPGGRGVRSFGPFTITASADLADLVQQQTIPPEYAGELVAQMEGIRDETIQISGISTSDSAVEALINTAAGPLTQAALSATIATQALPRSLAPAQPVDVDVNEAIAIIGMDQVPITTYAGGENDIVHPSLLFFDEGWNGWRYWMAYTPYNGGDAQVENPSIAVSNDGETWTVPAGLTNPIEPSPAGAGYLADPVLCMSADGQTMLMVFKINDATKQTVLRTSMDGVTWTPKVVLIDNTYEDVSPALLWDNGKYRMWTVVYDTTVTGGTNTMYVRTATAPEGPWSAPVACTVEGLPTGVKLWHMDIKRVGQQYHMVMASDLGSASLAGHLLFAKSNDGLAWKYARASLMDVGANPNNSFYKAGLLPKLTPDGLAYDMWYSSATTYQMFKTVVTFDRAKRRQTINSDILSAVAGLPPWTLADNFDRADTTTGLGTATSGHAWSSVLGNPLGIVSKEAYLPTAANSRSIIDPGIADLRLGVTYKTVGSAGYIMFRYVDGSNLWRVGHSGSIIQLQKIVAGALTTVKTTSALVRNGDRLEVEARGSEIRLYLNGLELYRATDSALSTGTKVGINIDNTTVRLDNFTVRRTV